MIRILHTADLHLGVETYGRTDEGGVNSRILDYLRTLDELVSCAVKDRYDAFLIAGDIFENERPKNFVISRFARRIRELLDAGVAVVITPGNHETTSSARVPSVLETIKALEPTSHDGKGIACHVLGNQSTAPGDIDSLGDITTIETRSGKLQILAMPYPRRSEILTAEQMGNQSREEIKAMAGSQFLSRIKHLAKSATPNLPTIFVGHFGLKEAHMQPGRMGYLAEDVVLSLYDLMVALDSGQATFSYVALGHYHNPQMPTTNLSPITQTEDLDGDMDSRLGIIPCQSWDNDYLEHISKSDDSLLPDGSKKRVRLIKTAYSGSPDRKDFSDGSRIRSFVDLSVDLNSSHGRCVKVKQSRQLRQLTLTRPDLPHVELEEKFFNSTFWHDIYLTGKNSASTDETEEKLGFPLPIFRLKIPEEARREWSEIRDWLEGLNMFHRIYVYSIPKVKQEQRGEIIEVAESPITAVNRYLESMDDEFVATHRKDILELAYEILSKAGVT